MFGNNDNSIFGATAIILSMDKTMVLCIARGGDFNDLCLAGGKIEENESPSDAAIRELQEETSIVAKSKPILVFSDISDRSGRMIQTFFFEQWEGKPQTVSEREGIPHWNTVENLCTHSPFPKYNTKLFLTFKNLFPTLLI